MMSMSNNDSLSKQNFKSMNGQIMTSEETLSHEALAEIWAKRAYEYAEPPPAELEGDALNLLVFLLNGVRYGVEVTYVSEIHPLERVTKVPRTPDFIVGIFNARGRLISVIDLRGFFGLSNIQLSEQTKIIVITDDETGMEVGIVADEVEDVKTVFKDDLEPPLTTQIGNRAEYTQGIAPGMLVVLNLHTLLGDKHLIIDEEIN